MIHHRGHTHKTSTMTKRHPIEPNNTYQQQYQPGLIVPVVSVAIIINSK